MSIHRTIWKHALLAGAVVALAAFAVLAKGWDGTLVQYGTMHEAVGKQDHQGRVALNALVSRPHFFGVAALEKLQGEVTIFDSEATVTGVTPDGKLAVVARDDLQATLLVGAYVTAWNRHTVEQDVPAAGFDEMVREAAAQAGVDATRPFMFTIEGEFRDVRMHVINGACPMHARMKKIEIPAEQKPFEGEYEHIRGRVVGVYASDAVGKLTHPATSTHVHLIFEDAAGEKTTGHVEQVGLATGAVLKLPSRE